MPIGAKKVALVFSAASISTVMSSSAVKNISMNKPCLTEVPWPRTVLTASGPGNRAETTAEATMPEIICATKRKPPLIHGSVPLKHIPKVTCSTFVSHTGEICAHIRAERTHRWVEQATADPIESPCRDTQGKAERQSNVE